jgi:hypothetical protein
VKRLLGLVLALSLCRPVSSTSIAPARSFHSPNNRWSVACYGNQAYLTGDWQSSRERRLVLESPSPDFCLINDARTFIVAASTRYLHLMSTDGEPFQVLSITPHYAERFVGGWIESDGSSYWETKQGDLLIWRRGSNQLEKIDPGTYFGLFESTEVSPISCLRLCLAHQLTISKHWLASHRKQILNQEDGPKVLQLYDAWVGGSSPETLVELLAKEWRPMCQDRLRSPAVKAWLSDHLENLCYAERSGCLPPWLISQSDLDVLLGFAVRNSELTSHLLQLQALRPDLRLSPALIPILLGHSKGSQACSFSSSPVRCLQEAEVDPALLCSLLDNDFSGVEDLLDYYSFTPFRASVDRLIKLLPKHPLACRKALLRQLRVDLGDDPAAWRSWIEQPRHDAVQRGKALVSNGDGSGLLWLARASQLELPPGIPRLIQRIAVKSPQEVWVDQDRVGLRSLVSPQRDWHWELPSGNSKWQLPAGSSNEDYSGIASAQGECLLESDDGKAVSCLKDGVLRRLTQVEAVSDMQVAAMVQALRQKPPVLYDCLPLTSLLHGAKFRVRKELTEHYWPLVKGHTSTDGRWTFAGPLADDAEGLHFSLLSSGGKVSPVEVEMTDFPANYFAGSGVVFNFPHCFSPDSRWLVIGTEKLTLVSTEGDAPHTVGTQAIKARSLAFQPKADRLAIGTENELVLLHLPDLKVEQIIRGLGPVNGLAYSPDGSLLAVALQDEIRVYQTKTPWPTQEGQDPQLLSELWTGMRLSGGAAVRLSEAEFKQRLARWKSETGSDWWDGCPKPVSQPGRAELPPLALAGLAVSASFLGYSLWQRRRSR